VRNGRIIEAELQSSRSMSRVQEEQSSKGLLNKTIHEIHDWEGLLGPAAEEKGVADWMNIMLGVPEDEKVKSST